MKSDAKFSHTSPLTSPWGNYLILLSVVIAGSFGGFFFAVKAQEVMMKGGQGYVKQAIAGTDYLDPSAMAGYQTLLTAGTANQYFCGSKTWQSRSVSNVPGRTIQTVAAAANGWQVSSTRDAEVSYTGTIACNVQIGLVTSVEGYVVLETAATNSTTAADWTEVARYTNGQTVGLALAFSGVQKVSFALRGMVTAGNYVRIRSVNVAGTPTFGSNGQQEVIL